MVNNIWQLIVSFLKAPARVRELEQQLADSSIVLKAIMDKLLYCKNVKSKIFADLTLSIKEKQDGLNIIKTLNAEMQALKDNQNITDSDKNNLIKDLQATALRRQGTIDNLTKQRSELQARLDNALVLDKEISLPAERAKFWWEAEKILWKTYGLPEVRGYETWNAQQVENAVKNALPNLTWHSPAKDGTYRIISLSQMKSILENSFVNLKPYIADLHDCDKFAQELRTHFNKYLINSMIEVWGYWAGTYHSRNLIVCKDGIIDIVDIEPQNDKFGLYPAGIGDNFIPDTIHDW